jgi:hypothetical protein
MENTKYMIDRIAIVFGTGACADSWNPILKALRDWHKPAFEPTSDSVNSLFALHVYHLREAYRTNDIRKKDELLAGLEKMKSKIKEELSKDRLTRGIVIREEFNESLEALKHCCKNYFAVTTNWDDEADDMFNNHIFHLHGSAEADDDLYLPSEVAFEHYRSDLSNEKFELIHSETQSALAEADGLIIYGLSFSPLDAELNRVFWNCFNSQLIKRIIIIDPEFDKIITRINFNFTSPNPNLKIAGIDPRNNVFLQTNIIQAFT